MKKDKSQFINAILIFVGGAILVFQLALAGEEKNPYILILGLGLLMFGLYRATNHWSYTKDDHLNKELDEEEEDVSKK